MNLCLVSGPTTAASIRHTYLRDNDTFLLYSILSSYELALDGGKTKAAVIKGRDNIRQWMEVNQNWKQRCSDPKKMKRYQEDGIFRIRFPYHIFKAALGIGLLTFELVGGRFLRLKSVFEPANDKRLLEFIGGYEHICCDILLESIGCFVISVRNGKTTCFANRGESLEYILERLKVESGFVSLEFMRHPDVLFCNPALAAEYGLVEVVQFLIEEKDLNVNGSYDSLHMSCQPHTLPLTASLFSPDISVLKYLLTVPGADFGVRYGDHPVRRYLAGGTLLHWLINKSELDLGRLEAVLGHKTVDINARLPTMNITALHLLCMGGHHSGGVEKMRLLLKHGANIHCRASEETGGATPLDLLHRFKSESNKIWEQKVKLLTQASGP